MELSNKPENIRRRARRLLKRKQRLQGKHCLNCDILLAERLQDAGRSYLYCRKCLTEYKVEARRNRWRRYWNKKKGIKQKPQVSKDPKYIVSWRTLKSRMV